MLQVPHNLILFASQMFSISFQMKVGVKLASRGHNRVIIDVAVQFDRMSCESKMQNNSVNTPEIQEWS